MARVRTTGGHSLYPHRARWRRKSLADGRYARREASRITAMNCYLTFQSSMDALETQLIATPPIDTALFVITDTTLLLLLMLISAMYRVLVAISREKCSIIISVNL